MALLLGDTGKGQIGSLKTFTITSATPRETLLTGGGVLTLPTTEPGTSQVIFTVQSSDLPTISPDVPMKYNASLIVSGKIGAVASIINYRVLKNSVSVAQASMANAASTQYWTHTHWRTFDIKVGDVLEVRYWAAQADVNLDFYGLLVCPSQPITHKPGAILKDVALSNVSLGVEFSTITATNVGGSNFHLYPTTSSAISAAHNSAITYSVLMPNISFGLFRSNNSEQFAAVSNSNVNATQRQVQRQWIPLGISFREILR